MLKMFMNFGSGVAWKLAMLRRGHASLVHGAASVCGRGTVRAPFPCWENNTT